MLTSTTNTLPGCEIRSVLGVINGTATSGTFFLWHWVLRVRDWIGGRSRPAERNIDRASEQAFEAMIRQAESVGANAVVGIRLNLVCLGSSGTTIAVEAYGTAVFAEEASAALPSSLPSSAFSPAPYSTPSAAWLAEGSRG